MHGEASSAPSEAEERRRLQEIIKEFPLEDVYNCDETGKIIQYNYYYIIYNRLTKYLFY